MLYGCFRAISGRYPAAGKLCSSPLELCSPLVKRCSPLAKQCGKLVKQSCKLVKQSCKLVKLCGKLVKLCSKLVKQCLVILRCSSFWPEFLESAETLHVDSPGNSGQFLCGMSPISQIVNL